MILLHSKQPLSRNRPLYAVLAIVTILMGLGSRKIAYALPEWAAKNVGDVLYTILVFFLICLLWPRLGTLRAALGAALFSFVIEFTQLYHAPWIDAIRHVRLGGLILGFGFHWSDLVCYLIGALLGAINDWMITRAKR